MKIKSYIIKKAINYIEKLINNKILLFKDCFNHV